ncbi:MAG: thioredoxin-disulfide reductase [Clostridia bacterium]|nr:thioredoxin-disulfide reductase [Clostridia bacterium]
MQHIFDMIVIGGGPAGYTSALYASRAGFDTLVLERMAPGGQMALTDTIDNYPGFENGVDGFDLGVKMQSQAERFGAKTEFADVTDVDFTEKIKKISTTAGEFFAKTIVVATGANPRELGIENEKEYAGKGVHYCAHCDGRFYKDKTVAVVGGGNTAIQDVLYLSRIAKKVYVIHRRDSFRATKIYVEQLKKAENIEILYNSTVESIIAEERVSGITVKNSDAGEKKKLECDALFVSIGRIPATEFLKGKINLDESGYIIADETTKTSENGVFAVGDVRTKELRQVVTAVADGAVAVHFAEKEI